MAAAVVSLAPAAQAPTGAKNPEPYFPTGKGARWVYDEQGSERVFAVTAVEEKDGAKLVTVTELPERSGGLSGRVAVSEKGLFQVGTGLAGFTYDTPVCLLRLPHKPGDRWGFHIHAQFNLKEYKGIKTVRAAEEVVVPAGRYTAIPVVTDYAIDGAQQAPITMWYARGVGLVKLTFEGINGSHELVLKSFTAGKD